MNERMGLINTCEAVFNEKVQDLFNIYLQRLAYTDERVK